MFGWFVCLLVGWLTNSWTPEAVQAFVVWVVCCPNVGDAWWAAAGLNWLLFAAAGVAHGSSGLL